jgi:hypothetical protein
MWIILQRVMKKRGPQKSFEVREIREFLLKILWDKENKEFLLKILWDKENKEFLLKIFGGPKKSVMIRVFCLNLQIGRTKFNLPHK